MGSKQPGAARRYCNDVYPCNETSSNEGNNTELLVGIYATRGSGLTANNNTALIYQGIAPYYENTDYVTNNTTTTWTFATAGTYEIRNEVILSASSVSGRSEMLNNGTVNQRHIPKFGGDPSEESTFIGTAVVNANENETYIPVLTETTGNRIVIEDVATYTKIYYISSSTDNLWAGV